MPPLLQKKRRERGKRIPSNFEPSFVIPPIFTTTHKIIRRGGSAAARERQAYSERRGSVHCENSDKQATGRGKGEQAGKAHWQAGKGKKAIEARLSSQSHRNPPSTVPPIQSIKSSRYTSTRCEHIQQQYCQSYIHCAHPFLIVLLQTLPAVLATTRLAKQSWYIRFHYKIYEKEKEDPSLMHPCFAFFACRVTRTYGTADLRPTAKVQGNG